MHQTFKPSLLGIKLWLLITSSNSNSNIIFKKPSEMNCPVNLLKCVIMLLCCFIDLIIIIAVNNFWDQHILCLKCFINKLEVYHDVMICHERYLLVQHQLLKLDNSTTCRTRSHRLVLTSFTCNQSICPIHQIVRKLNSVHILAHNKLLLFLAD